MKRKISWKTIGAMLMTGVSATIIMMFAVSHMCLTWEGTILFIAILTLGGYSLSYLCDRYDRLFK